jgi:hypothetical protein
VGREAAINDGGGGEAAVLLARGGRQPPDPAAGAAGVGGGGRRQEREGGRARERAEASVTFRFFAEAMGKSAQILLPLLLWRRHPLRRGGGAGFQQRTL